MRLLYPAALLVSAAAIGYEILLVRVLSIIQWHHFAWMIISLALFGYAASGTAIALCRRYLEPRFAAAFSLAAFLFAVTMLAAFVLAQRVPFNALEIIWQPAQFLGLTAIYLIFMVPFFFAASCIGIAFTCRQQLIDRIYFFDLTGAGIGGILILVALFRLSPPYALILLSLVAFLASVLAGLAAPAGSRRRLVTLQLLGFVATILILPPGRLDMRMSEYKSLSQTLQIMDARVLEVASSPLGLLTVVESPTIPFRHAPGLSMASGSPPPEQLAIFTDGDDMSVINRFDGDLGAVSYVGEVTSALPYQVLDSPRVLVLGAGGGTGVLQAIYHRASHIDAVELNPQVLDLVSRRFAGFAGHVYERDGVTVHVDEARGFVARSSADYDLIQIDLLDSFATAGSGAQGLNESYLYTVEALGEYVRHLSPGGVLAITRWLRLPPRDSLKLAATAIDALKQSGAKQPGRHLAMIRGWNTSTLLVSRAELTVRQIDAVRAFSKSRSFDTVWYPGMLRDQANRYNLLDEPQLHDGITALLGSDADAFVARYKFDIAPATDDKPYFFHFLRWRFLPEMLSLARAGGAGLIEWGYLVLVATFIQAVLAGLLLILLPLGRVRRNWEAGTGRRMGSYFFLLGLAFLFVEIAFIQKFILFLSHPVYSVAAVLSGFLVFAGIGSATSSGLVSLASAKSIPPVLVAATGIAAIACTYLFLLPPLFDRWIGLADAVKIVLAVLLIAPLAFCMGMPFPIGLKAAGRVAPAFIPWAWGINGFASVVSAVLATLLAIEFGFTIVLLIAIIFYALAAVIAGTRSDFGAG